jgi:hypothetical protein
MRPDDAIYIAAEAIAGEAPLPWLVETLRATANPIGVNNDTRTDIPDARALGFEPITGG